MSTRYIREVYDGEGDPNADELIPDDPTKTAIYLKHADTVGGTDETLWWIPEEQVWR